MNEKYNPNYEQSFSGSDINIMFIMGGLQLRSLDPSKPFKHSAEIQTLTISSTTSVMPVRSLGNVRPLTFTKGARTFAGSMIFTVIDMDPFQELFAVDIDSSSKRDGSWHIDEMPPFDILIMAANETGKSGMQLISGVTLTNYGTTYSVDDIYTEITYTYVAEHVSPFVQSVFYDDFLKMSRRNWITSQMNPDGLNSNDPDIIKSTPASVDSNALISLQEAHKAAFEDAIVIPKSGLAISLPGLKEFKGWYGSSYEDPVLGGIYQPGLVGLGKPKSTFGNAGNLLWP
jgi:hypothetical protein